MPTRHPLTVNGGVITYSAYPAGYPAGVGVKVCVAEGDNKGDGLEARVLSLARGGLGWVEIAAALGRRSWRADCGVPQPLAQVNIPYNGRPQRQRLI